MKSSYQWLIIFLLGSELNAQTGINTTTPVSRFEVKGSSSDPSLSGSSSTNGVLRISEGATSNLKALDFGINRNRESWIQPRLNSDYSVNHNLLLNPNGGSIVIGNSPSTAKLNVGGTITASGTIRSSQAGQLLNTVLLNEGDLSISSSQTFSNQNKTVASFNYTPVSSSSKIIIEFHAQYSIPGASNDEWKSYLLVGSTVLQTQRGIWSLADGAGGRGSNLFPLRGVFSNTTGNQITIKIDVEEISGDDNVTIFSDLLLTIREVAQ